MILSHMVNGKRQKKPSLTMTNGTACAEKLRSPCEQCRDSYLLDDPLQSLQALAEDVFCSVLVSGG